MALYDYRCGCGALKELRYPVGAAPETTVHQVDCGRVMRRVFSPPALAPDGTYSYRAR